MAAPTPTKKPRGLAAVRQSQEDRAQRRYRLTPGVGYIGAAVVIATAVLYKCVGDRSLNLAKEKLLAKQNAAIALVGPAWFPLEGAIEQETMAAAKVYEGDYVDPTLATWDFRSAPGIYLRLRAGDAGNATSIREAAAESARDGFTGCLLRVTNQPLLDNVPDAGAMAELPWTLDQAYEGTHVLTDEWTAEVREAENTVRLNVLEEEFEQASNVGIPLAARIVHQAQYFLLVVDEDVPAALPFADGGPITEASLELVPHPSRVYLFDLRKHKEALRLRRTGSAGYRSSSDLSPERADAMQRQVNSCSLAQEVAAKLPGATPAGGE